MHIPRVRRRHHKEDGDVLGRLARLDAGDQVQVLGARVGENDDQGTAHRVIYGRFEAHGHLLGLVAPAGIATNVEVKSAQCNQRDNYLSALIESLKVSGSDVAGLTFIEGSLNSTSWYLGTTRPSDKILSMTALHRLVIEYDPEATEPEISSQVYKLIFTKSHCGPYLWCLC